MRPLTTRLRNRPTPPRAAVFGLAAATALALAGCTGSTGKVATTVGGVGKAGTVAPSATPTPTKSYDPDSGPTQDASTLPKTCNGLLTDAAIQLTIGAPLAGNGDVFTAFLPTAANQTGKVLCQYGELLDGTGKFISDQLEVQLATYTDEASAKSRVAATVASMAAQNEQFKQDSAGGHPVTIVTEPADTVLVAYDGNRTFLITVQQGLAQGARAEQYALAFLVSAYNHTLPAPVAATPTPGSTQSPGASPSPNASGTTPTPAGTPAPSGTATP
jgi:hypothetical protein